jgi:hypothetical protein
VTVITSSLVTPVQESNHRSVEGELPNRNVNTKYDGEIKKKKVANAAPGSF